MALFPSSLKNLFGIVPEGLVLPEEVRPFGVSPASLCFGLGLSFFRDLFALAMSSWFFILNFPLILSVLAFYYYYYYYY